MPATVDQRASPRSETRGFLFADIRGYTQYVERQGAAAAADLLLRYRAIVRQGILRNEGAEIRTEGDSFYVVLRSASDAVLCGLAIVDGVAEENARQPNAPIRVGVGIHAGEAIDTAEGLVGSAVNVAARVCALAGPGEVLTTDTVRGLARSVIPVTFTSRGSQRLKGVDGTIEIYRALWPPEVVGAQQPLRRNRSVVIGGLLVGSVALAVVAVLAMMSALGQGSATSSPTLDLRATRSASPTVAEPPQSQESAAALGSPSPGVSVPTPTLVPLLPDTGTGINIPKPVAPGTYRVLPFPLTPHLTLADGWSATTPQVDQFRLVPTDRPTSRLVFLALSATGLPSDPCSLSLGAKPTGGSAFLQWLRANAALDTDTVVLRKFTFVNAEQVDVSVQDDEACLYGSPRYAIVQPFGAGQGCCTGFQLQSGEFVRAYAFELDGDAIAAFAVAPTQEELDILLPKVEDVLFTLKFNR